MLFQIMKVIAFIKLPSLFRLVHNYCYIYNIYILALIYIIYIYIQAIYIYIHICIYTLYIYIYIYIYSYGRAAKLYHGCLDIIQRQYNVTVVDDCVCTSSCDLS